MTSLSPVNRIDVSLGNRSYPIEIHCNAHPKSFADAIGREIDDLSHAVFIVDQAVADDVALPLSQAVASDSVRISTLLVPPGETSKSAEQLEKLWNDLLDVGTDRRTVVVAVGGGVVGDLAGFVAATYNRGLRLVQVPTTLLSMVDSSVGGKTGINLRGGKNIVGAFWQPELVWINTSHLSGLMPREYRSGLAEVIKYGVIDDAEFFDWLTVHLPSIVDREPEAVAIAISRSCHCKANVVGDDERETTGRRAILNYGHTFAHAIEATAGYGTFLHGEAVSIGMQMAARLAIDLELCDETLLVRQTDLLTAAGLPLTWAEADPARMLPVMARDKKVSHGKLRFILPRKIGHVELVGEIDPRSVESAILESRFEDND